MKKNWRTLIEKDLGRVQGEGETELRIITVEAGRIRISMEGDRRTYMDWFPRR